MKNLTLLFIFSFVLLLITSCTSDPEKIDQIKDLKQTSNIDVTQQWNFFVDSLWTEPTFDHGRKFISEKIYLNMTQFDDNFFQVIGTVIDIEGDDILLNVKSKKESVLMNPIEHYLIVLAEITNTQDFKLLEGSTITINGYYSTYNFKIKNGFKALVSLEKGEILEIHE